MGDLAIKVDNVSKKFSKRLRYTMLYGGLDLCATFFGIHQKFNRLRKGEFWALKDIDFEIKKGEAVGLVGANGAGKSTMLKMLNGIYMPDNGEISVYGKIGALIQVGAGFHPMLTGRENIYVNGEILGMTKKYIDKQFDSIVDFSGIEDFIDTPVKHYSSGMYVRLGFAVIAHCKPDILLIDEVLAVGDAKFKRKCLDHLRKLQKQGVTFLIVSHNMQSIQGIAEKGIFFDNGKLISFGDIGGVISKYEQKMFTVDEIFLNMGKTNMDLEKNSLKMVKSYPGWETAQIKLKSIKLLDQIGTNKTQFDSFETVMLEIKINSSLNTESILDIIIFHENSTACINSNHTIQIKKGLSTIYLKFDPIQLTTGRYKIGVFFFDKQFTAPYASGHFGYFECFYKGPVLNPGVNSGYCRTQPELKIIHLN